MKANYCHTHIASAKRAAHPCREMVKLLTFFQAKRYRLPRADVLEGSMPGGIAQIAASLTYLRSGSKSWVINNKKPLPIGKGFSYLQRSSETALEQ